jgi:integrase/recombinase XerD
VTARPRPLGPLIQSFFADHLVTVKGLRPASVRSYRDTIRLLLCFAASDKHTKITRLSVEDLTFDRVLGFLRYLEHDRGNHARTRNQRLAALHTLFDYIASREPQMLDICQQVAAIPAKRAAPAETRFLERDEVEALFRSLPTNGRLALRDRALLLFLYNTGARVQEAADLRAGDLDLGEYPVARLHGKGDKWRTCPLWRQTAQLLRGLLGSPDTTPAPDTPVFRSGAGQALTRFGIYKIVRRHAGYLDDTPRHAQGQPAHLPPHCGRPPPGGRRRGERHPRLARARRPHHDEPLCRDQHQSEDRGAAQHRTTRFFGGNPRSPRMADRRGAAQLAVLALTVMWPVAGH